MPTADETRRLVSPKVAGEALEVSPETVRRLVRQGKLPGRKIGSALRVDLDAILANPALRAAAGLPNVDG